MTGNSGVLEVRDVSKLYNRTTGVRGVSFDVARGEIVGLLGPNGAGKTTIMRVITGFLAATAGTVKVAGRDIVDQSLEARRCLGYLPETPPVYSEMTVTGYLRFVAQVREVPAREVSRRVGVILEQLDLSSVGRRLIGNLSKGYRQRVGLAQALVHDPPFVVLDEPSSSLDPAQTVEMRNMIRRLGEDRAVLLSSHLLTEVERLCARVVILNQGRMVAVDRTDRLAGLLRGGSDLRIQVRGDKHQLDALLSGLPGLEHWSVEEIPDGAVVGRLHPSPGTDIREAVFFRLAEAGCPLLEMRLESSDLESVFMALTRAEVD